MKADVIRLAFVSDVTDKLLPQIEQWQKRPLSEIYPVLFIDEIHYSVRDSNIIRKLAAYVMCTPLKMRSQTA